jgi:hypothetical protein
MLTRWLLSQFFRDSNGNLVPVCTAYGARWFCPRFPSSDDGWALVQIWTSPDQVEAAKTDPRVVVCDGNDFTVIPQQVADTYATDGVTAGMMLGQARAVLGQTEPQYLADLR